MDMIINADDLGANESVNRAVFELMELKRITSGTIIANGNAVEELSSRVAAFPHCSFGIHLNLSEFRPLTCNENMRVLLNSDGCFCKSALRSTILKRKLLNAILEELSAQIEKVQSIGVKISHFDSHHHIHTIPGLFGVVKRLQRRFGVSRVRLSMNLYKDGLSFAVRFKKFLWISAVRYYYKTTTTEAFTSFEEFLAVSAGLKRIPRTIELMTHPGSPRFDKETKMLYNNDLKTIPYYVRLISYNDL